MFLSVEWNVLGQLMASALRFSLEFTISIFNPKFLYQEHSTITFNYEIYKQNNLIYNAVSSANWY